MPTENEHRKKYQDNKELLDNELSLSNSTRYNWILTVAFYSALHLVEARLASYGFHGPNHAARDNMVYQYSDFKNIRAKYKDLHTKSIIARYSAEDISKEKAKTALRYLEDIEKELL